MSKMTLDIALKSAEQQVERDLSSALTHRMKKMKDLGAVDSFRNTILAHVMKENYPRAIEELKLHLDSKGEYPQFKIRSGRYIHYAVDLVNAIKAKRSFPGLQYLAMAKQKELIDRAMAHFDDLNATLKKVEKIDRDVRLQDVRSTVLVVKALVFSLFAVLAVGFLLEISKGVLPAAHLLFDDAFGKTTNWLFDQIGW